MNSLKHQNYNNENTSAKNPWCDWLIKCIPELVKKYGGWC